MKAFVYLLMVCSLLQLKAQNTNLDFSSNNFNQWVLSNGTRLSCCLNPGVLGNSHTIVSTPGNDGIIGAALPRIPSGLSRVARLGDPAGGAGADGSGKVWRMVYPLTIYPQQPLLHYQVAVVTDATHVCGNDVNDGLALNSFFTARVLDASQQPLDTGSCSTYTLLACFANPGGMSNGPNNTRYLPWNSVGLDLSAYAGQSIQLEFTLYSCYYAGFHGNSYAYLTASELAPSDTLYFCKNAGTFSFSALPRFRHYAWSNGDTLAATQVLNPVDGQVISCTMHSFNGCSFTRQYVLKESRIQPGFSTSPAGCYALQFQDTSQTGGAAISQWQWNFGNPGSGNNSATQAHPQHAYNSAGTYTVSLSVTNTLGCVDSLKTTVQLEPADTAAFQVSAPACEGQALQFHKTSPAGIGSQQWDFGDPASGVANASTLNDPTHIYAMAGSYPVQLLTTDAAGCQDTLVETVLIHALPLAQFSVSGLPLTLPDAQASFHNQSSGANTYSWDFGDGHSSSDTEPQHSYPSSGYYTVTLSSTSSEGCVHTTTLQLQVLMPRTELPNVFTPNGDGLNDRFLPKTGGTAGTLQIFNRWGNLLYESTDLSSGWDGIAQGEPAAAGTYFYVLSVPGQPTLQGWLSLFR